VKIFRGYRKGQKGDACLVTVQDDGGVRMLDLPELTPHEDRHSPDGFQWGYDGSGPAELARAILIKTYPGAAIVRESRCYLAFKREVIATMADEWTLDATEIAAWFLVWRFKQLGGCRGH
jgi:hypothetical protein